jgi:hypothetical protein
MEESVDSFIVSNASDSSEIEDASEEDVSKEMENLDDKPRMILKSARRSDTMPLSKEVDKRISLHPNVKLNSGELKTFHASYDSEGSNQCQSKRHNKIEATSEEDVSNEMENLSTNPEKVKTSKRRSDTMLRPTNEIKRMTLHPSARLNSTTIATVGYSSVVEASDKRTSIFGNDDSNSVSKVKNVNSTDNPEATANSLMAALVAKELQRKKAKILKAKIITEEDKLKAIEKALATRDSLLSNMKHHSTKKRRQIDTTSEDDEVIKPKNKKRKTLSLTQQLAAKRSEFRILSKTARRKKIVGKKEKLPIFQFTTAGPFTITNFPTTPEFVASTSHFEVTSLSDSFKEKTLKKR